MLFSYIAGAIGIIGIILFLIGGIRLARDLSRKKNPPEIQDRIIDTQDRIIENQIKIIENQTKMLENQEKAITLLEKIAEK